MIDRNPLINPPFNTTSINFSRSSINFYYVLCYVLELFIYFLVFTIVGLVGERCCHGGSFVDVR